MKSKTASRLAWSLWIVTVILAAGALTFLVLGRETPPPAGTFGFRGFGALGGIAFSTIGALVASRRPSNAVGWIFCAMGIISAGDEFANQYAIYAVLHRRGTLPFGKIAAWVPSWNWVPITGLLTCFVCQLFPSGRPLSTRWRPALYLAGVGITITSLGLALLPGPLENFAPVDNPFGVESPLVRFAGGPGFLLYLVSILVSVTSLIVRFRRSTGEERQQLKWFVSSAGVFAGLVLLFSFFTIVGVGTLDVSGYDNIVVLSFLTIPCAAGIAILKYRLYDIDVVINKAVVYGVLAACITAFYVAVVIGIGSLVGTRGRPNVLLSIAATALIAVAFQPARQRVQRFADRLVYGERVTPYEAMADFSHRMAASISLDEVLPRMAEASARGVGAQRARVRVFLPGGGERAATWPSDGDGSFETTVAVIHHSEEIGEIAVAKPASAPMNPAEHKLLEDLASQASLALGNVRLTEDLKESRQRIVAAQDTERKRIERNLHDGAQQQLVAMKIKLGLIKQIMDADPIKAGQILQGLIPEADAAIENLRDLARGIFPQVLVENGLVAALRSHISKSGLAATVESNVDTGRFDPTLEAAVYFCCLEAMQNASKHAPAQSIELRLTKTDDSIQFSITDHGPGFDPNEVKTGSGLQNMADRVEALGGSIRITSARNEGTSVMGKIPL